MRNRRFLPSVVALPFRITPSDVTAYSSIIVGDSSNPTGPATDPTGTGTYIPGCGGGSSTSSNNSHPMITPSNPTH